MTSDLRGVSCRARDGAHARMLRQVADTVRISGNITAESAREFVWFEEAFEVSADFLAFLNSIADMGPMDEDYQ